MLQNYVVKHIFKTYTKKQHKTFTQESLLYRYYVYLKNICLRNLKIINDKMFRNKKNKNKKNKKIDISLERIK